MSPLRPAEFVGALVAMSLIRLAVGVLPVTIFAILFFGFNLWALGIAFAAFFVVLMLFAWSIGLFVSGILLRYGLGAENLVWSLMFFVQPLGAVYYPVTTLPSWLQPISWMLPPTYVFEGLRGVLIDHVVRWDLLAQGFAIDVVSVRGRIGGVRPAAEKRAARRHAAADGRVTMAATRADTALHARGLFESRAKAREAIEAGLVTVDGRIVKKPSEPIAADAHIVARAAYPWVSRGGVKLAHALEQFGVDPDGRFCLDVGASTGGFTDVLLTRGARHVVAVDVGHGQLHARLRGDPRVTSLEGQDARTLTAAHLDRGAEPDRDRRELHFAGGAACRMFFRSPRRAPTLSR